MSDTCAHCKGEIDVKDNIPLCQKCFVKQMKKLQAGEL